jgi:predicted amidohydrolase YtcJ
MIFYGGEILTLDPTQPAPEALAVREGKIIALGALAGVRAADSGAEEINLQGRVLLPSLKDHHVHVLNVGFAALNRQRHESLFLDLTAAKSEDEVARRVAEQAAQTPPGQWIFGNSWNQRLWGTEALPTHHKLTAAAPQHPVMLIRVDAHCAWLNAAALTAAGISRETPELLGGAILRLGDGAPSGILLERAAEPALEKFAPPPDGVVRDAFRAGARLLAAQGITDVYDAGFLPFPGIVGMNVPLERYLEVLVALADAELLPININLMVPWPATLAEAILSARWPLTIRPRLRISHIKLFADGALGSRGAALSRPYADDPSMRGVFRMTTEEIREVTQRAIAAGLDVATHAIGDAAVRRTLDAYEEVLKANPGINPRRLRVEHFSAAQSSDVYRAVGLGVLLSVQPGFIIPDADGRIMEDHRLGANFSELVYPWATLEEQGAVLAGGSDDFTYPNHPLWGFYAAATRKNSAGQPPDGWHPEEKLSRQSSLRLFTDFYTQGGVVARGMLRKGAPADLVILSANPLTVEESRLLSLAVHATYSAGRATFSS